MSAFVSAALNALARLEDARLLTLNTGDHVLVDILGLDHLDITEAVMIKENIVMLFPESWMK